MLYKFDWDQWNRQKSILKHGITNREAESVFKDNNRKIAEDEKHSFDEKRYICIGRSEFSRILFVVFTERNDRIRIISSRIGNKKDHQVYES